MTRMLASASLLLTMVVLTACAKPYNVRIPISDGSVSAMKPGQTAFLANKGSLRYVRLINDSRCAPDVQCVWAGDAVVALHWMPANSPSRDLQLHLNEASGPNYADLDGRRVTFTYLSRQGAEASFEVKLIP